MNMRIQMMVLACVAAMSAVAVQEEFDVVICGSLPVAEAATVR